MPIKICIITPGTIASNPRVVKEAAALSEAGYHIHLIYSRHVDYLVNQDEEILNSYPDWTTDYLDWASNNSKSKLIKLVSGIKRRASNLILKSGLYPRSISGFLLNRFYFWQLKKAVQSKSDLYIAHYPDSIEIAAKAAKENNVLFAYDAEDYHRGEDLPTWISRVISESEDRFLSKAAYISGASKLIAEQYRRHFPKVQVITIENMFPLKYQGIFHQLNEKPLKFFWFSQTIGPKRGLEEFVVILNNLKMFNFKFTLLGNVTEEYKLSLQESWIKSGLDIKDLIFIKTVPEKEIFEIASNQHFGLCLEIPAVLNKDLCMSNKLYTYLLCGNALILSHTRAQKNFHECYPESGVSIDLTKPEEAAEKIKVLMENELKLNLMRENNYNLGRTALNFDKEKTILVNQLSQIRG